MNSLTKIILGLVIGGLIYALTPILELLELFLYIVLLPLTFLFAFGLISEGVYNGLVVLTSGMIKDLKTRVNNFRNNMVSEPAAEKSL